VFHISSDGLRMHPDTYPLVRVIAGAIDMRTTGTMAHSSAI